MRRPKQVLHVFIVVVAVVVASIAGCAPASNQWAISEIHPAGAAFPFSGVRLAPDGKFQAQGFFDEQGQYTGREETIEGDYQWDKGKLSMKPESGPTVTYKTRRRIDGSLLMTLDIPGQEKKIKAVMRPIEPSKVEPVKPTWTESSTSASLPGSPPPKPSTASER